MTSWTAEVEWREDLRVGGHPRHSALRWPDWGNFHVDAATGTVTAAVSMEAPALVDAMDAVLLLVSGLTGQPVTVNRIIATDRLLRLRTSRAP